MVGGREPAAYHRPIPGIKAIKGLFLSRARG